MTEKAKILVVEHDVEVRSLCKDVLEAERYDVITASGAKEALAEVEQQDYDLVLTGMRVPKMDGAEFLKALRKKGKHMHVIAMTGCRNFIPPWKLKGFVHIIDKPFELEVLKKAVSSALSMD